MFEARSLRVAGQTPRAQGQHLLQVWDLEMCKCVGTLLRAAKPVAHLELAAGRLYAASVRRCVVHILQHHDAVHCSRVQLIILWLCPYEGSVSRMVWL